MIVTVTIRQLKEGTYDAFREAWQPEEWWPGLVDVTLHRHEESPDQVLVTGRFDMAKEEFDAMRDRPEVLAQEDRRLRRIAPFEESVLENAVFEVAEVVAPPLAHG